MKLLILSTLIAVACARPQDYPGESEVEIIEPVSNQGPVEEAGDGPFVIVVRGQPSLSDLFPFSGGNSNRNPFNSNPFFTRNSNPFPGFGSAFGSSLGSAFENSFKELGSHLGSTVRDAFGGSNSGLPSIFDHQSSDSEENDFGLDLDEILGTSSGDREEVEEDVNGACGPLCSMFNLMKGLQGTLHGFHQGVYGNGTKSIFDNEYDLNNSTFEEKVLEDGTVVRINRTVLADKDGFGNSIYIKTFVSHNIEHEDSSEEVEEDVEEMDDDDDMVDDDDEMVDDDEVLDAEVVYDTNAEEQDETAFYDGEKDALPSLDESFNEVDDAPIVAESEEFPGVDKGLQE